MKAKKKYEICANQVINIKNQENCEGSKTQEEKSEFLDKSSELKEIMDENGLVLSDTSVYEYDLSCFKGK